MKLLLLGYGKEGKAAENYFKTHSKDIKIDIWQDFTPEDLANKDFSPYDLIFRSPSVPPISSNTIKAKTSSVTKYFFENCPCQIIGVTATKGKGTTCSFIKSLLATHGEDVHLVGNIGEPAINALDELTPSSVVVYEMSSFQLWDLTTSPHIAVVGTIEPDHLNVHNGYEDYLNAKANICRYQTADDICVFYQDNPDSVWIANHATNSLKIPYPFSIPTEIKEAVKIPGKHNIRNAIAALAAVASFYNISPDEYIKKYQDIIIRGLSSFKGLPHRLEFVREIDGVKFYDDNFSTNPASTRVAIEAFPDQDVIPIIGGRDKTNYEDLPEIYEILNTKAVDIPSIILIGESGHEFAQKYQDSPLSSKFVICETLEDAVKKAWEKAQSLENAIVLMSPTAASFDMFKDVYDRGDKYQKIIQTL